MTVIKEKGVSVDEVGLVLSNKNSRVYDCLRGYTGFSMVVGWLIGRSIGRSVVRSVPK